MQTGAAASLRRFEPQLTTELRKTGAHHVIGECVPLLRDKERVRQGVVAEGGAQDGVATDLRGGSNQWLTPLVSSLSAGKPRTWRSGDPFLRNDDVRQG